jgi:hypothetical protein
MKPFTNGSVGVRSAIGCDNMPFLLRRRRVATTIS